MRVLNGIVSTLLVLLIANSLGCGQLPCQSFTSLPPPPVTTEEIKLASSSKIAIHVLDEPDLSLEAILQRDGSFNYPLCGQILLKGLTPQELQATILRCLQKYLLKPIVQIEVKSWGAVGIAGWINKPGSYPYQPKLTLSQLIATAGGLKVGSKPCYFMVNRRGKSFQVSIKFSENFFLLPEDLVFIPESLN